MLIRFNVENFLSFDERTEFSLIANRERRLEDHYVKESGINILKSSVLYGANASGKSNLVKSIFFSQRIITRGLHAVNSLNKHFRLNKLNVYKPTIFNYEIKIGSKFYAYGFAIQLNENKILEEWLNEIGSNKSIKIFDRFLNEQGLYEIDIPLSPRSKDAKRRFDVYRADLQKSQNLLFLSEINRKSIENFPEASVFVDVFKWFDERLTVLTPDSKFAGLSFIGDDQKMSEVFSSFLSTFRTGINSITSEEVDLDSFDIPKRIKLDLKEKFNTVETLFFEYKGNSYALKKNKNHDYIVKKIGLEHLSDNREPIIFEFEDESDGTQRLFDFIPALHALTQTDAVFVIDEIDRSLHSKLTYAIFELFFKFSADNESQLIATTHEALLLDLNLFRRDEIWFVEKENNSSKIYSLDQFKERSDKVVSRSYLLGRYGAIPIFKSFNHIKL